MDSPSFRKHVGCDMCNWFFGYYPQYRAGRLIKYYANDVEGRDGMKDAFWLMDFTCYYDHTNR